jgi:hypothetical protein
MSVYIQVEVDGQIVKGYVPMSFLTAYEPVKAELEKNSTLAVDGRFGTYGEYETVVSAIIGRYSFVMVEK